ncbi:protein of unknown function, might belong to Cyclase/dehydrase [Shewanella benthica]|uniref:Uncharacterized protein n=1 Tax=Shewanella benthica TaxID=43661 RepID=A0A330M7D8_9GAMM|nr:protein of unknown function, might belong to Cyclase/dehydrase [Shewanella benthica]
MLFSSLVRYTPKCKGYKPPLVSQRDYTLLVVNEVDTEKGQYSGLACQYSQYQRAVRYFMGHRGQSPRSELAIVSSLSFRHYWVLIYQ